jgi:(p)ppGpp synthase/HD superfamily hydrolase
VVAVKINNYQSLHIYVLTNILMEIQIRNNLMHTIAINGSASNYY